MKDLGIQDDDNLNYKTQRQKAFTKVLRKLGWVRRTFSTRSTSFLKVIWNSLLQPHLDYGSVLVAPHTKGEKLASEKPLRSLTKMSVEARKLRYWERLQHFKLYSNERRMERYRVMYLWKSLNGLVPSLGIKRKARDPSKLVFSKVHGREGAVRTQQRYSISWEGVRLFNSLPRYIRDWKGNKESFKNNLDKFLALIPDQPELPDRKPEGRTLLNKPSNSIPDWIQTLGLCDEEVCDNEEDDGDKVARDEVEHDEGVSDNDETEDDTVDDTAEIVSNCNDISDCEGLSLRQSHC